MSKMCHIRVVHAWFWSLQLLGAHVATIALLAGSWRFKKKVEYSSYTVLNCARTFQNTKHTYGGNSCTWSKLTVSFCQPAVQIGVQTKEHIKIAVHFRKKLHRSKHQLHVWLQSLYVTLYIARHQVYIRMQQPYVAIYIPRRQLYIEIHLSYIVLYILKQNCT